MTVLAKSPDSARDGLDPITFSVILSRLNAIVDEMTRVLERSAWTSILAIAHDYSCAIYDAGPRQLTMHDALPIHTSSLHLVVSEIARCFESDVHAGDVFLCNDPHSNNTHIGDYVAAAPVFADGKLVFWSVAKGHQLDTGAYLPSSVVPSARNVYQEGVTIPPTRLISQGVMRDDVLRLVLANLRYADLIEGDLRAQMGAIVKGRQRLEELCAQYGTDAALAYVEAILDYSKLRAGQEFEAMPDGSYEALAWVDSDGVEAEHIPVKVSVTIDGDAITIDYAGSGPQGKGGINGSYATAQAAGVVPFLHYIDPEIPHNHGVLSHIEVAATPGTICYARFPASTSVATIVPSDLMQDVVNMAMVQAMPERVPAGGARCSHNQYISGVGADGESPWGFALFNGMGGAGAAQGVDGWPLWCTMAAAGGLKILPVEQIELLYPLFVETCEIEPESMGLGQWLGGPGVRCTLRPLVDEELRLMCFGDGVANPPYGAMGATAGVGGGHYVEDVTTGRRTFYSMNGSICVDHRSERYVGVSTGGGGWGNPHDRDVESVRRDVRDGVITRLTAFEVFGVKLDDEADPGVDEAATHARRDALARVPRPRLTPTAPDSATWLHDTMRPGDAYVVNPAE